MSTPDKKDPALAWLVVEELIAEQDDEYLLSLSPEERRAEYERRGVPEIESDSDDVLAEAIARVAKQAEGAAPTTPEAAPPAPSEPVQRDAPAVPIRAEKS